MDESIDKGLWDTLRAIEERVMLLRQAERLAHGAGDTADADRYRRHADDTERRLKPLREMVLDARVFGHEQPNRS